VRRIVPALLLAALLLPVPGEGRSQRRSVTFTGVQARDQDAQTMERGLSRLELDALRSFRTRESVFVIVAPSQAAWERDVAPKLETALSGSPRNFKGLISFLPPTIERAGPDISGAVLQLQLPHGRGTGAVAFHLPPIINDGRSGTALLNSPEPNKGHLVSGVDLGRASDGDEHAMTGLYLPSWASPLGRTGPPEVPLRTVPEDGRGSLVLFRGTVGDEQRDPLWDLLSQDTIDLAPMDTFPRRLGSLTELLRSVRLERTFLDTTEGQASTVAQAPNHWKTVERTVRHPTRYASLVAPVAVEIDGEEHTVVVGVVAFYTPLLMDLDEAALWFRMEPKEFADAVYKGQVPFFRDGETLLFWRGWLERWARDEALDRARKPMALEDAREQAQAWGKGKLRGLDRASQGPLPMRMVMIPDKEREGLVDDRLWMRPLVDREDLAGWLRRFEPGLKPGDRQPAWTLRLDVTAAEASVAFSLEEPWEPPPEPGPALSSSTFEPSARTGTTTGGGPATATLDGGSETTAATVAEDGVGLQILDLFTADGVCRIGGEADAALAFDVQGVPDGSVAKLRVEWDLLLEGRSVSRDAWGLERGAGGHEVEFAVPCPKDEGSAELYVALLVGGREDLLVDAEAPLEVRPPGGKSWAPLRMPDAKACLGPAASEGTADDEGFSIGGSAGLSADQIGSAIRGFQRQTLRCREGKAVSGTVEIELIVGCDGRVSAADVLSDGTGDSAFADCVARTMTYAPFPAHDLPDGAIFGLPLRFE